MVAGSRNCPLRGGAKIRRKTVTLIRDFCENQAAGIDAKRKLACSGSIHCHDAILTFLGLFPCRKADIGLASAHDPELTFTIRFLLTKIGHLLLSAFVPEAGLGL
jgi:hypothetical protein